MFKTLTGRIITLVLVVAACSWQLSSKGLKQGLDLQGGMHLVLEVADPDSTMTDEAKADAIDRAEVVVRSRIDELGVEEPLIQKQGAQRLIVELAGVNDQDQARSIVAQAAFLQFKLVLSNDEVLRALPRIDRTIVATLGEEELRDVASEVSSLASETSEVEDAFFEQLGGGAAADSTGGDQATSDSTVAEAGDSADAEEPAEQEIDSERILRPLTSLLSAGDIVLKDGVSIGNFLVAVEDEETVRRYLDLPEVERAMPRDQQLHWGEDLVAMGARMYKRLYVLTEEPFMTGDQLEDATAGRDPQFNQPQVQFELTRRGGRDFSQFTGQHVQDYLAILLDQDVISAPVIRDRIGASGQIDMAGSSVEDAAALALVLRAGALPAPLEIIEERTVGPSLGADSIAQGEIAGLVGLLVVVVIMAVYYKMAGILAILALAVYCVLVMGGLAGIEATLTLPGIAGLILSIGMAVDANVLIFERIREELAHGRATRTAVDEGFAHALSAIVDANITTLFTALVLFQFGTGPVQGFAVTLSIGIVASFFSALFVTRTFFLLYLRGKKASDPISI